MRYIGRDDENIFLKCRHCKKIRAYDRESFGQQAGKKCINCNASFRIIWGYPIKIPDFLRYPPFLIMTGLSLLVIFIISFPPFQRYYYFNKSITALNPLMASILVPALCSFMSVIAEVREGFKNKIKLLAVIALESVALIFFINISIDVKYHCLEIKNPETDETQQYFGSAIGNSASGKGRLFDSKGNLVYAGDFKDSKYDGYGEKWELIETIHNSEITQSYQCVYEGQFKEGEPHGHGCEYCYDAEYVFQKDEKKSPYLHYEGEFVNGKYGGYGTLYNITYKHEGMFYNGKENGYVNEWFLDTDDNMVYKMEAIFVDGKLNGAGKKYFSDGSICFDGVYSNGKATSGKWYYRSGDLRYEGELDGNDYNGTGTLYWDGGPIRYEGEWSNGNYNGEGILYWENGQIRYEGEWNDNKREGYGTSFREKGTMEYSGYWKNGQYSGFGTVYYDDGQTIHYEGSYTENKLYGNGTEYYRNGNPRYKGEWNFGSWDGKGIWYWDNGEKYCDGNFMMDSITGEGTLYTKDGVIAYQGSLYNGKKNGRGTSYWGENKIRYEGDWKDDLYSGEGTERDANGNVINSGIFSEGILVSQAED